MKEKTKLFNSKVFRYLLNLFPEGEGICIENTQTMEDFKYDSLVFHTYKNQESLDERLKITADTFDSTSLITFEISEICSEYILNLSTGDYENVTTPQYEVPDYSLYIKILEDIRYFGNNALSFIMGIEDSD